MLSFCELVPGSKNGLKAIEKTIIDRADLPLLSELHAALVAQHIPVVLDLYVNGFLNVFNHCTNVNIENHIVTFDIKELGKQLKKLWMLIVQDQIWNRVTQIRNQGKTTYYFDNEFRFCVRNR